MDKLKKEFEEKFCIYPWGKQRGHKVLSSDTEPELIWEWIEQNMKPTNPKEGIFTRAAKETGFLPKN